MNPLSFLTTVAVSAETDPNAQFTLKNAGGMEVRLAADGARITALKVPDRAGLLADVVLGHDAVDSYRTSEKKPYLGATLGHRRRGSRRLSQIPPHHHPASSAGK